MTYSFLLPRNLTVIKSHQDARNVLDRTSENNVLIVTLEGGKYIRFVKNGDETALVTHLNEHSNAFNSIEMQLDINDAVKRLYDVRKHFNARYKD